MKPIEQHQVEIWNNLRVWQKKPLLQIVYTEFYRRMVALMDRTIPGVVVEIGSGIGNLRAHLPDAICTDLFNHPWLDVVCDGYEMPFDDQSVSHLVLLDVFHHLRAPKAFLREARRVLAPSGRMILCDPYISWCSYPAYEWCHHEPVAWREPVLFVENLPAPRSYYAAQGNATRLFFTDEYKGWLDGWDMFHAEAFSAFSYLLTGGFSKPMLYPKGLLPTLQQLDVFLSRWPKIFAAKCVVGLRPVPVVK